MGNGNIHGKIFLKLLGKKTSYHAKEVGTVDRYTTSETVTKGNVTTITNTHKYETVDKTVTKIWTGTNETEDNNWKMTLK